MDMREAFTAWVKTLPASQQANILDAMERDESTTFRAFQAGAQHEREAFGEPLEKIEQWAQAYPLDIFPKPDLAKVHAILEREGCSLDGVSADAMRHVITTVWSMLEPFAIRSRSKDSDKERSEE